MKTLFIAFAALCSVLFVGCSRRGADYSTGSGFERTQIDSATLDNLEVLGRVWGYVKYHHPVFADDGIDIDYELFDLLPRVADADPATRNRVLAEWIDGLGQYKTAPQRYETILSSDSLAAHCTEVDWIRDTIRLGQELSDRLVRLRYADRRGNYYVSKTRGTRDGVPFEYENPCFDHEKPYGSLSHPDYGYRLLAVFRFWNMVEYFFPSKYLTDKDWNDVLPEYILRMAASQGGHYRRGAWRMIAELDDNHAQIGSSSLFGDFRVPLNVGFVDGKLTVITPDAVPVDSQRRAAFRVGDEILAIDGKPVEYYASSVREFIPCSNENDVLYIATDIVLRSHQHKMVPIRYRRGEVVRDTLANAQVMPNWFETTYLRDRIAAAEILDDSIGYIYPAKYEYPDRQIVDILTKTKGLIVDMRCYPTREFAEFMGRYIVPDSIEAPFRMTYPVIDLPGVFYAKPLSWVTTSESDKYPHPIVVLVDSGTQSYAETSVQWMQMNPRVTVIGTQSAGANGNISRFTLPGNIESCFSGLGWYYPDGWVVNRQGVKVDVEVKPTIRGVEAGRNEVLEAAIRMIHAGAN